MHSTFGIFPKDDVSKFQELIEKKYFNQLNYHDMQLSKDEWTQLHWYMFNTVLSPEASGQDLVDKVPFEVQRGLARRYSFELLIRGDEAAHKEFIQKQNQNAVLSFESFQRLSKEARSLDPDLCAAIRASCFLTMITGKTDKVLAENGYTLSKDSEVFLSELLPTVLMKNKAIFPLTQNMSDQQLSIMQKMFWPNMH